MYYTLVTKVRRFYDRTTPIFVFKIHICSSQDKLYSDRFVTLCYRDQQRSQTIRGLVVNDTSYCKKGLYLTYGRGLGYQVVCYQQHIPEYTTGLYRRKHTRVDRPSETALWNALSLSLPVWNTIELYRRHHRVTSKTTYHNPEWVSWQCLRTSYWDSSGV